MASKKACFVIIGFGPKPDLATGRVIDLDKTFENLIKPVFDELKINCFRAKEIRHTGIIDVPMYDWIYKADIVVADISTLNPNAMYELGVRHALRPNTTIVISENQTGYPFDVNHTVITPYEHLGKDIGVSEATRFKKELKTLVQSVLKSKAKDSPVYTFLPKLIPPKFDSDIGGNIEKSKNQPSLSELINDAEHAKNNNEFVVAGHLYSVCLKFEPQNVFLRQRLALVTYKSMKPSPIKALQEAEKILAILKPGETTDTETIGLSGAINKRLFEINNDVSFLDKAIWYYSKGYFIAQDYYNGINYAFLLTIKATLENGKAEALSYFIQSQRIRQEIVAICSNIIKGKSFKERGDKEWIYQSLAQAYLGLNEQVKLNQVVIKIQKLSKGQFDIDTFNQQNEKLSNSIKYVRKKYKYYL